MKMEVEDTKVEVDPVMMEEEEGAKKGFVTDQQIAAIINPNRSCRIVEDDLQQLMVETNPGRVKFTITQRLNTQLFLDDYDLRMRSKGPTLKKVSSPQHN